MIRCADPEDIHSIQTIARETWPVCYASIITPEQIDYMLGMHYSTDTLLKQLKEPAHRFFLFQSLTATPIGFLAVNREPIERHLFKIQKLYVLPTHQKEGIGQKLLFHCIQYVMDNNGQSIILQVNRQNSAITFYEKMGFSIWKSADIDIGSGFFMNDYIMRMDLPRN
jgi:ribosomal protein S18 acetylase RimI-like enzyme